MNKRILVYTIINYNYLNAVADILNNKYGLKVLVKINAINSRNWFKVNVYGTPNNKRKSFHIDIINYILDIDIFNEEFVRKICMMFLDDKIDKDMLLEDLNSLAHELCSYEEKCSSLAYNTSDTDNENREPKDNIESNIKEYNLVKSNIREYNLDMMKCNIQKVSVHYLHRMIDLINQIDLSDLLITVKEIIYEKKVILIVKTKIEPSIIKIEWKDFSILHVWKIIERKLSTFTGENIYAYTIILDKASKIVNDILMDAFYDKTNPYIMLDNTTDSIAQIISKLDSATNAIYDMHKRTYLNRIAIKNQILQNSSYKEVQKCILNEDLFVYEKNVTEFFVGPSGLVVALMKDYVIIALLDPNKNQIYPNKDIECINSNQFIYSNQILYHDDIFMQKTEDAIITAFIILNTKIKSNNIILN